MTIAWRLLRDGEIDHERVWLAVGLLTVLAGLLVSALAGMPPLVCPLKAVTGLPCPTCGATRAGLALLAGRPLDAVRLNPLMAVASVLGVGWAAYAATAVGMGPRRLRVVCSERDLTLARWTSAMAVAACWTFLVMDGR